MRFNYYKKKMYDYKYNNSSSLLKEIEKIRKSEGISKKKTKPFWLIKPKKRFRNYNYLNRNSRDLTIIHLPNL